MYKKLVEKYIQETGRKIYKKNGEKNIYKK